MNGAVLVTGGGRRIGRSISLSLASSGFHVVIQTRSVDNGINLVADEIRSLGSSCTIVEGDLESLDSPQKLFSDSIESLPNDTTLVGLVNCASMFQWDAPSNVKSESLISHYKVNSIAPILLSSLLFNYLKEIDVSSFEQKISPCIVNILDQKLVAPHPDHFSYTLSKHALSGATIMMAKEFAPFCRVNAVLPGHVLASPDQTSSGFEKAQSESPLGYGPSPSDIAEAVTFLFRAKSVTAQSLVVDAGEHLLGRSRDVVFETEGLDD